MGLVKLATITALDVNKRHAKRISSMPSITGHWGRAIDRNSVTGDASWERDKKIADRFNKHEKYVNGKNTINNAKIYAKENIKQFFKHNGGKLALGAGAIGAGIAAYKIRKRNKDNSLT